MNRFLVVRNMMYTPGKLDAVMDSDFDLGYLPLPKRTLFAEDVKQKLDEDEDSGLGMDEVYYITPKFVFLLLNVFKKVSLIATPSKLQK